MKNILILLMNLAFIFNGLSQNSDTIVVSKTKAIALKFNSENEKLSYFSPYDKRKIIISKSSNTLYILGHSYNDNEFGSSNIIVNDGDKVYVFIVVSEHLNKPVTKFIYDYQDNIVSHAFDTQKITKSEPGKEITQDKSKRKEELLTLKRKKETDAFFISNIKKIESASKNTFNNATIKSKYNAWVDKIYVDSVNNIYIQYHFNNKSNVDVTIDTKDFYVRNKRGLLQKGAIQDIIKTPIFISNNNKIIERKSTSTMIFVFEKIYIENKKSFYIELWEKNGDRKIILEISAKEIQNVSKL